MSTIAAHDLRTSGRLLTVRQLPLPAPIPPEVIGIDDWAWLKGQRYGTIIVDLERQQPIALLAQC